MNLEEYFDLTALLIALVSAAIALISYYKNVKTRELAIVSFRQQLMGPYLNWRDSLGTIELDPSPGENFRKYSALERRKIRDYWPKVAKVELELLKRADKKILKKIWEGWERLINEGIGHRSVLQEFCYYARYEDAKNDSTKEGLVDIVKNIYQRSHREELKIDEILKEREKFTHKGK